MIRFGKPSKNGKVKLTFILPQEQMFGSTSVVGDFNDWSPFAHPLKLQDDGTYQVSVTVSAQEELRFRYLANGGIWFDDPDADRYDEGGGYLSPASLGWVPEMMTDGSARLNGLSPMSAQPMTGQ